MFAICDSLDWRMEGDWPRMGKMIFGMMAFSLIAAHAYARAVHWTVAAFYAYVMIQWVLLRFTAVSLIEITMFNFVLFGALYASREDKWEIIPRYLLIDATLQSILGTCEVFGFEPVLMKAADAMWAPWALMGHPTVLGPYLVCAFPFVLLAKRFSNTRLETCLRVFSLFIIIFNIFAAGGATIVLPFVLMCVMISMFYSTERMRMLYAWLLLGGLGVGIAQYMDPVFLNLNGRYLWWKYALQSLTLQGHGAGVWHHMAQKLKDLQYAPLPVFNKLHNDFLQGVWEHGIGTSFIVVMYGYLAKIIYEIYKRKDEDALPWALIFCALSLCAVGNFPLRVFPMGFLAAYSIVKLFHFYHSKVKIKN
jgi:hypothetical protein